jgi:alkylation response protein AidB-like acyl-CoA dehydrogenase
LASEIAIDDPELTSGKQVSEINLAASYAKLFTSEVVNQVTYEAIQILGGYGYIKEFPIERMWRDARLFTIGAGTSEIQRMIIATEIIK